MADIDVTEGLSPEQLRSFEALLEHARYESGVAILAEGQSAAGMFLLRKGTVSVSKRDMGGLDRLIIDLEAPAVLGELELLSAEPCSATVTTQSAVELSLLPAPVFEQLLIRGDLVAIKIMRNLARALANKLNATNEVYVDLAIWR